MCTATTAALVILTGKYIVLPIICLLLVWRAWSEVKP